MGDRDISNRRLLKLRQRHFQRHAMQLHDCGGKRTSAFSFRLRMLRQGMKETGVVESENVAVEYKSR